MKTDVNNPGPLKKEKFEAGYDFSDNESSNINTNQTLRDSKVKQYNDSDIPDSSGSNYISAKYSKSTKNKKEKQVNEVLLKRALGNEQKSQQYKSSKFKQGKTNKQNNQSKSKNDTKPKFSRNNKSHSTTTDVSKKNKNKSKINDSVTKAYHKFIENTRKRNSGINPMQYTHEITPGRGKFSF